MIAKCVCTITLATLLLGPPGLAQNRSLPPPSTKDPAAPVRDQTGAIIPETTDFRITLQEALVEKEPEPFAQRLSTLLGVEVRLPRLSTKLKLPAGKWTTEEILDHLAGQIVADRHIQGVWRRVFVFKPRSDAAPKSSSRLQSAGQITLNVEQVPFAKLIQTAAEAVGCRAEASAGVPGRYSLRCKHLAVEDALAGLASQAEQTLSFALVFDLPERGRERPMTAEEKRIQQGLDQQAEDSKGVLDGLALLSTVENATGLDPLDAAADWNQVDTGLWDRLGFGPADVEAFMSWIQDQIENARLTEAESWEMLSGNRGELGNTESLPDGLLDDDNQ